MSPEPFARFRVWRIGEPPTLVSEGCRFTNGAVVVSWSDPATGEETGDQHYPSFARFEAVALDARPEYPSHVGRFITWLDTAPDTEWMNMTPAGRRERRKRTMLEMVAAIREGRATPGMVMLAENMLQHEDDLGLDADSRDAVVQAGAVLRRQAQTRGGVP